MTSAGTAGVIKVEMQAETARFVRSFQKAQKAVKEVGKESQEAKGKVDGIGSAIKTAGMAFVAFQGARVVLNQMKEAVQVFAEFERGMVRVGAVTNTVGTVALGDMTRQAQDLAKTTEHTGREVADAMGFLGMAGMKANQIMEATPSVLQLASAGMMDVASAADVVTNVLSSYSMKTADLKNANNILTSTFTNSNTSLSQLGEAFKYVGSVAQSAGFDFKEISASIGLLGNSGIQASMAGTSLRGAIARLQAPTKQASKILSKYGINVQKADGSLLSMKGILDKLNKSGIKSGDTLKLFGLRAGPAMQVLMKQGSAGLAELEANIDAAGNSAERIAAQQLATLDGQIKIMQSTFEATKTTIGQSFAPVLTQVLIPSLKTAAEFVDYLAKSLSFFDENQPTAIDNLAEKMAGRRKIISGLQADIVEMQGKVRDGWITEGEATEKIARHQKRITELRKQNVATSKFGSKALKTSLGLADQLEDATAGAGDAAAEYAKQLERAQRAAEKTRAALRKEAEQEGLKEVTFGPAHMGAIKLKARGEEMLEAARQTIKAESALEAAEIQIRDDIKEMALALLKTAKTYTEFTAAADEFIGVGRHRGISKGFLAEEDKQEALARIPTSQFAADLGESLSDVDHGMVALGEQVKSGDFPQALNEAGKELRKRAEEEGKLNNVLATKTVSALEGFTGSLGEGGDALKEMLGEGLGGLFAGEGLDLDPAAIGKNIGTVLGKSTAFTEGAASLLSGLGGVSSLLGGGGTAISGAAIGSVAPGIGTAVGAAVGVAFAEVLPMVVDGIKQFANVLQQAAGLIPNLIGKFGSKLTAVIGDSRLKEAFTAMQIPLLGTIAALTAIGMALSVIFLPVVILLAGVAAALGAVLAVLAITVGSILIALAPLIILIWASLAAFAAVVSAVLMMAAVVAVLVSVLLAMLVLVAALTSGLWVVLAVMAALVVAALLPLMIALGVFLAILTGITGSLALFGAFLSLATKTDSFKRFQEAFSASVDRVVLALEPFFENLMALAGLFDALMDVVIVFANAFASTGGIARMVFNAFKAVALMAAGLLYALGWFQNALYGLGAAIAGLGVMLIDGIRWAITAIKNILNPLVDHAPSTAGEATRAALLGMVAQMNLLSPDMAQLGEAFAELTRLTFEEATERGNILADRKDTEDQISESLTNIPEGFKVAAARFRAIVPGLGDGAGTGTPEDGRGGNNFFIENFAVVTDNLEEFVEQIQRQADSRMMAQTGSPIPGGASQFIRGQR